MHSYILNALFISHDSDMNTATKHPFITNNEPNNGDKTFITVFINYIINSVYVRNKLM